MWPKRVTSTQEKEYGLFIWRDTLRLRVKEHMIKSKQVSDLGKTYLYHMIQNESSYWTRVQLTGAWNTYIYIIYGILCVLNVRESERPLLSVNSAKNHWKIDFAEKIQTCFAIWIAQNITWYTRYFLEFFRLSIIIIEENLFIKNM